MTTRILSKRSERAVLAIRTRPKPNNLPTSYPVYPVLSMFCRIVALALLLSILSCVLDNAARAAPLESYEPAAWWTDADVEALARITAAEARGDTDEAQRGIVRVILNRLYSDAWGDKDVFAVISRPGQFSAYEDTHYYDRIVELRVYENVVAVLEGDDPFYGDTEVQFFRSKATKGEWKGKRKHVVDLGDTAFFR